MIEKRYNPKTSEKACLSYWEKEKTFHFINDNDLRPFCIMMPPPNITGSLHMGHALTFSLQDILVRFQKKLGKSVLWQSGTDHAGIATEIIVEKKLREKNKKKKELGRKRFVNEIWKWKEETGNSIIKQLKRLGTAVDWSRKRFTMDQGLSEAVNKVFVSLFDEGIIYRDKRLVNWDPKLETAVSDLEVNQKEVNGKIWYLKYKIFNSDDFIEVATTRPETIFGDVAIAVHPDNKKYCKLINKFVIVPVSNKKIPIIADTYADPNKGSGAVKITPAHDFNDFLVGKRHSLEIINIFNKSAKLNENVTKEFIGLDRFEAREKLIHLLRKGGNLLKEEQNVMTIPIGDRSGAIIEPFITDQWFCDAKELSKPIKKMIKDSEIKFHPESWVNTFNHWIENIEPWCISRQIWWGHRIPAWYLDSGEMFVAENLEEVKIKVEKKLGTTKFKLYQDQDVLDTWFSSALWPFSTLGWPKKNEELNKYYPTDVLITGFDIIFFLVARMVMMGKKFMKAIPFKNIYIHPLVKDKDGIKMSKSKGNVIDPLDLIELYGADALRYTLASLSTQGRDIKLSDKLVENNRNFITKIWNIARFFEMNKFSFNNKFNPNNVKLTINKWIYNEYIKTQKKIIFYIENFHFNYATEKLYQFIWNDFCDLYLEFIKPYLKESKYFEEINNTFSWVFRNTLNLANPFLPFVTEEISMRLSFTDKYELLNKKFDDLNENINETEVSSIENIIIFIKNLRDTNKNRKLNSDLYYKEEKKDINFLKDNILILNSIFGIKKIIKSEFDKDKFKIFVSSGIKFGFLDENLNNDIENIKIKINFLKKEILFFEKKLSNKNFLKNAPQNIVEKEIKKLEEAKENLRFFEAKR